MSKINDAQWKKLVLHPKQKYIRTPDGQTVQKYCKKQGYIHNLQLF